MKKELSFVLNYALNKGFQIHPDAFKILDDITDVKKLEKIIKEIVKEKTRQKQYQINQNDLETYLGIKDDPNLQSDLKVLSDPTEKITSGEGVKGYNALFSSRFNKLKRIISERPESKMLKSISVVKSTKLENDVYVCGLVTARNAERNITKLVLEDPSGSFEGIIFDDELQKTAGTLLIDQFVMVRVATAKNSGLMIKDLIMPDLPDQKINKSESEVYAVFLSDLHIGSKYFMEEELVEFVKWISSPDPVARKVRFAKRTFLATGSGLDIHFTNSTNSSSMKYLLPICKSDKNTAYTSLSDLLIFWSGKSGIIKSLIINPEFLAVATLTITNWSINRVPAVFCNSSSKIIPSNEPDGSSNTNFVIFRSAFLAVTNPHT